MLKSLIAYYKYKCTLAKVKTIDS